MAWTREAVRGELLKIFRQHAQQGLNVRESSHLVADLGIDSLGVAEVIADIEDQFKLVILDEALREVDTIADVAAAIEARLKRDGRLDG
jgi:acyl carrier protein